MRNIIEMNSVTVKYKEKEVLKDFSWHIKEGTFITLCGRNGCGKTTTIKALLGLVPSTGEIQVDGKELKENLKEIRSLFSVVFENPNANLISETVQDEFHFVLKNKGLSKKERDDKIQELASFWKIDSLLKSQINHLSGGEKQLISVLSVLLMEPKILILDEPFTMLDGVMKEKMMKYIKKYHKEKKCTIILLTHDSEDLLYGKEIAMMGNKSILKSDIKENVITEEKLFKEVGVALPFMAELSLKLKYYGLVDEPILQIDKMVKHLWK